MLILADAEGVAFITGGATVIAALFLGGLAAWAAERRLTKQIADSGTRQERELAAEAERQAATLAHDRDLADLADLRALLDEATVALDRARDSRSEALVSVREAVGFESSLAASSVPKREVVSKMVDDAAQKLEAAGRPLVTLVARLRVRLGSEDPISDAFNDAAVALNEIWRSLTATYNIEVGLTPLRESLEHDGERFTLAMERFLRAAVKRAGTSGVMAR